MNSHVLALGQRPNYSIQNNHYLEFCYLGFKESDKRVVVGRALQCSFTQGFPLKANFFFFFLVRLSFSRLSCLLNIIVKKLFRNTQTSQNCKSSLCNESRHRTALTRGDVT